MPLRVLTISCAVALTGCDVALSELDQIYSRGADGPVVCGANIDNKNTISSDSISVGLDRAQVDGAVIHLYSHRPAGTVDESTIEQVVAGASDRDLPFVTYRDMALGSGPDRGLALSFDDRDIAGWHGLLPMFARYRARVTFFISQFHALTAEELDLLHAIADAGHSIDYHSTNHLNAQTFSQAKGIEAYLADEVMPDLAAMRVNGFDPLVFAYPFGSRNAELDAALAPHFRFLRASDFNCPR